MLSFEALTMEVVGLIQRWRDWVRREEKERERRLRLKARLVCVFKQQFSVFLKIRVGKKMCRNTCNIV